MLNEAEFERTLADIDEGESLSGSEDSSASEDVTGGVYKRRGINPVSSEIITNDGGDEEQNELSPKRGKNRTPLLWLNSSILPKSVSLGIYRAVLPQDAPEALPYLRTKQLKPTSPNPPHFFLCMIGGGHFAAMVASLAPTSHSSGERTATVLAHKTFHRYTTRRKQGGAQSANDAAKGNAHSAGSTLRRYNEAELNREIRELLATWKAEWINTAELLFIRAAGTTNRRTIFYYEGAVISPKDPRIRGFPFSTRRATQSELMRAFVELTRIKVSHSMPTNKIHSHNITPTTTVSKLTLPLEPNTLQTTPAERQLLDHTSTIISLIRKSKTDQLSTYLSANVLTANFTFYPAIQHSHTPTPLHFASSINAPTVVSALLTKAGANPTLKNREGKVAYEMTKDMPTRDAFRLSRAELGEHFWDWMGAKVGPPLTPEDITIREEKKAAEKRAREEREVERRKREVERLKKEEEEREIRERRNNALRTGGGGVKLGATTTLGGQRLKTGEGLGREREVAGMTPEVRMRLERERRARAAEARIRASAGGDAGGR